MTRLTDTQSRILSRAATRPGALAMPLPEGLHGAAAQKVITMMIDRGWIKEVAANIRRDAPLWRETGDGFGTTLIATAAGLEVIGIEPVVAQTVTALRQIKPEASGAKPAAQRAGTKQALLIALLRAPEGASIEEIIAVTGWQAPSVRGAISGGLKKKLGLEVSSGKIEGRGRVYRLEKTA